MSVNRASTVKWNCPVCEAKNEITAINEHWRGNFKCVSCLTEVIVQAEGKMFIEWDISVSVVGNPVVTKSTLTREGEEK